MAWDSVSWAGVVGDRGSLHSTIKIQFECCGMADGQVKTEKIYGLKKNGRCQAPCAVEV